ncbi:MAG: M43 family zinc metalloprotease [Bacteroidota bacterium]
MKYATLFLSMLMLFGHIFGQQGWCGFDHHLQHQSKAKLQQMDRAIKAATLRDYSSRSDDTTILTIPVVFHILHQNGPENIADSLVFRAMQELNESFRYQGFFNQGTGADSYVEFCLATTQPDGTPFNGIRRIETPFTRLGTLNAIYNSRESLVFNPNQYLNIFVNESLLGGALLGIAAFPNEAGSSRDAINMDYQYVGASTPDSTAILTHEVGHILGLYHTFQDGCDNLDCLLQGDRVCDTRPDLVVFEGCSTPTNSCNTDADDPSVLNPFTSDSADLNYLYMDYNETACMNAFSPGQVVRMRQVLRNYRPSYLNSTVCQPLPALDAAVAEVLNPLPLVCDPAFQPSIVVSNTGQTPLTSFDAGYQLGTDPPRTINWTGNLAFGDSVTLTLPPVIGVPTATTPFRAFVVNPNAQADGRVSNDTLTVDIRRVAPSRMPISEDFEGGLSPQWTLDPAINNAWQREQLGCAQNDDGYCLRLDNTRFFNFGPTNSYVSPPIDLRNDSTAFLFFDVAYAFSDSVSFLFPNDILIIEVSEDCGQTYPENQQLYFRFGRDLATKEISPDTIETWTPTCDDWRTENIGLLDYAGKVINIRFRFVKDLNGFPVYIDNININSILSSNSPQQIASMWNVFPNPASDRLFIQGDNSFSGPIKFELMAPTGQVVLKQSARVMAQEMVNMDVSSVAKGIYFLRLTTNGQVYTQQVLLR